MPSLLRLVPLVLVAACAAQADKSAAATRAASAPADSATPGAISSTSSAGSVATPSGATALTTASAGPRPAAPKLPGDSAAPVVRGLYVNRFAAQSAKKMRHLLAIADSTEINAFVVDMKDEFGLNFASQTPEFSRNAGSMGKVRDIRGLVDTLHAHHVLAIARIVVFKDSVTARVNPQWTIRQVDGSTWRDHKGLAWVNPYHRELWNYNIGIAEELVRLGFDEIQFDYIRFPEPYKSLPQQVFPDNNGQAKPDAIAEFLKTANARLDKLGARTTADIFGLVTTVGGPLEVAQHWERLAPVTDVLLPMTYPSHYPPGSFGLAHPNAEPYAVQNKAISRAKERNAKLGVTGERVRPWIQAFTLGKPPYGPAEIEAQKKGIYDAGYKGWVLWHPGSQYDLFVPALGKKSEGTAGE